jgi:hypothetical protein
MDDARARPGRQRHECPRPLRSHFFPEPQYSARRDRQIRGESEREIEKVCWTTPLPPKIARQPSAAERSERGSHVVVVLWEAEAMVTTDPEWLSRAERGYPGFQKALAYYESLRLPVCPRCGGEPSTLISGLTGRTIALAAATTRVKLLANRRAGNFFCSRCDELFVANVQP